MQLTRAADYAVRVMIHLAGLPPGTRLPGSALAAATGVPDSFMSKVLQGLVRARLIWSRRGVDGGFELAAAPESTTLLEVVEAIQGPIQLNRCLGSGESCERQPGCVVHAVWAEAQSAMLAVLRGANLAGLARRAEAETFPE
jgi:Rrf2 family protein